MGGWILKNKARSAHPSKAGAGIWAELGNMPDGEFVISILSPAPRMISPLNSLHIVIS